MALRSELPPRGQPNRAIRVTLSYKGRQVRLIDIKDVQMLAPPSDPVYEYEGQSGFWYELRDADDRTLYRRVIGNPIAFEIEALSGDPERPFTRQLVEQPEGTFVLVAPVIDEARSLVLVSSPLEPEKAGEPAEELVRFDLRQQTEGKSEVLS
jgi:hypothetical protein